MKNLIATTLILALSAFSLSAQFQILNENQLTFENASDSKKFISYNKSLTDITLALDQTFDEITSASDIRGFNAAVRLPDGTIWERASGISNAIPDTLNMEIDHHMGMGSITKTFVSATILTMMEDGLLSLEDSIGMYIDEYPNIDGSATIRQLLSMRTGFNDYLNENPASLQTFNNNLDSIWIIDTILNNFVLEPNFEVGAAWSYSNTNYAIAGKIIENISGRNWYEEVRSRILEPLNLNNTYSYPWEGLNVKQSNVFFDIDGDGTLDDVQANDIPLEGFFSLASSAGNLVSLPKDIANFMKAIFGSDFLQASTLDQMKEDFIMDPASGAQYGLGQFSYFGLPENNGHNGSVIYQSTSMYFSDLDLSIALQQNDQRVGDDVLDIYDVLFALLDQYIECQTVSSTHELSNNNAFNLYPNPSDGFVTLTLNENVEMDWPLRISILNTQGQLLSEKVIGSNNGSIDISNIGQGMFIFKVGNAYQKVIIKN